MGRDFVLHQWKNVNQTPQDQIVLWDATTPIVGLSMSPSNSLQSEIQLDPFAIEGTEGAWTTISRYAATNLEALRIIGNGPNLYAAFGIDF